MTTLSRVESAFQKAHEAGDSENAALFAKVIKQERKRRLSDPAYGEGAHMNDPDVPGFVSDEIPGFETQEPEPEKSNIRQALDFVNENKSPISKVSDALVEVPTTMATGMLGQGVGIGNMIHEGAKAGTHGGPKGLDEYLRSQRPEQAHQAGAGAVTYQPRTEFAQSSLQKLAEAMKPLPPVLGPSIAQANIAGQAARGVAPIARARVVDPALRGVTNTAISGGAKVSEGARRLSQALTERKQNKNIADKSVGAAELDRATLNQARAHELDDPIDLTIGEATGSFDAKRFERETAKMPEGKPFRDDQSVKNQKVANNLDLWIDEAGSELVAIGDKGRHLDDTLTKLMNRKSDAVGAAYREAEAAGDMAETVQLRGIIDYLNDPIKRAESVNDGILKTTRRVLIETGAAREVDSMGPNNQPIKLLIPNDIDLVSGEEIRKSIGNNVGIQSSDRRQARLLKRQYDADTEGLGGQLYKRARSQRREFAEQFENNELVRKLTSNNPKSGEKLVAIEAMVDTVLSPSSGLASVDRLTKMRTLLLKDPDGRQTWKEIQGELVERIKTQTFRTSNFDENGHAIPSYAGLSKAIADLDRSGKLDIILSKKGAEKMRTLQRVVREIYTAPPGAVNHSNTATVIASLIDGALFSQGIPVPAANALRVAVAKIKDKKLKAKIERHLRGVQ